MFVVLEDILQSFPSILGSGVWLQDGVQKIVRDGTVNPLKDDSVQARPKCGIVYNNIFLHRCSGLGYWWENVIYDLVCSVMDFEQLYPRRMMTIFHL